MNPFRTAAKNLPGHWYKGDYTDHNGNYCIAGHVAKAYGYSDNAMKAGEGDAEEDGRVTDIMNSLALEFSNGAFRYVADFNDCPETTEQDAVALLEKAAVLWDEQV